MTHRFIAPATRVGVASKDGRMLGSTADPVLRDGGPVPVMAHFPGKPWTGCGQITSAAVLDGVLLLSGTIDNPAIAELLDDGTFFLSIGVTAPEAAEPLPPVDELAGFGWSQEYPLVLNGWTVHYALAADSGGKPWTLPDTLVWEES